ncbi:MAG: Ppx/GppA family phosphatase [Thermoplasmata archaeon]|nr:Ppx/GppA family phosphatase [Thermoplasmata archaeon]
MHPGRALVVKPLETTARAAVARQVAVIDVGSNTARLVIFDASEAGCVRAAFEQKESPRLGFGTDAEGNLSHDAMERGHVALERFAQTTHRFGDVRTVGVTTSAVRDAPNGPSFVDRIRKESGISLRVLSGTEEARYAYLGVASAWELGTDLVCDLGGGSLQVASVREGRLETSVSLPLGALRLAQKFFEHDPPKDREIDALRDEVRRTLEATMEAFPKAKWRLFGVGGTVRSLAKVAIGLRDYPIPRVHGYPLRAHDLEALEELLTEMPAEHRGEIPGIGNDRKDVIISGLVVFDELLRATGAGMITVSSTGIREGLALEEIHAELPASAEELAHRSVRSAGEALEFSVPHGEAVEALARQLFSLLAERMRWEAGEGLALSVAAWMHDSGTAIDLWKHARHSAYLIRNVPLWGLAQREVLLASMAAYLHEGDEAPSAWRKEFLPILKDSDLETARKLGTIVFAAEVLGGVPAKLTLPKESTTLTIALDGNGPNTPTAKALDRIRKPLRREFGLEVRLRDS